MLYLLHELNGIMASNNYFEMKQMRIEQGECAMKVSTDACIQGAWTPINDDCKKVLDIGTGTALLSLMIAQRANQVKIDAIELDASAAKQAKENVAHSIFCEQITVIEKDIQLWEHQQLYDLIICNPPFFSNSLPSPNEQRNLARHNKSLSQAALVKIIAESISAKGIASVLLPISEQISFEKEIKKVKLNTIKRLLVKPFEHSAANRCVILFSKKSTDTIDEETLIIYSAAQEYSSAFTNLMQPFYLHL